MKEQILNNLSKYSKAAMQTALSPLSGTSSLTKLGLAAGGGGLFLNKVTNDYSDQFQQQSGLPVSPNVRFGGFGKAAAMSKVFNMARNKSGLTDSAFMNDMQSGTFGNAMFGMTGFGLKAGMIGGGALGLGALIKHGSNKINERALLNETGLSREEFSQVKKHIKGGGELGPNAHPSLRNYFDGGGNEKKSIFGNLFNKRDKNATQTEKGPSRLDAFREKRSSIAFEAEKAKYAKDHLKSFNKQAETMLSAQHKQEMAIFNETLNNTPGQAEYNNYEKAKNNFERVKQSNAELSARRTKEILGYPISNEPTAAELNAGGQMERARTPNAMAYEKQLNKHQQIIQDQTSNRERDLGRIKEKIMQTEKYDNIDFDVNTNQYKVSQQALDAFDEDYLKPKAKKFAGWGGFFSEGGEGLNKVFNKNGMSKFVLGDKVGRIGTGALGLGIVAAGAAALIGGAAAHISNIPLENNLELATNFANSMDYQRNMQGADYNNSIGEPHQIDDIMLFGQGEAKSLRGVNLGASGSLSLAMHKRRRG